MQYHRPKTRGNEAWRKRTTTQSWWAPGSPAAGPRRSSRRRGSSVLLLERGHNIEHVQDYVNAHKAPWEYPHRGGRTYAMEEAYPVLRRDYPLNEKNLALVGQRAGIAVHRDQAVRLVPRLSRRRPLAALGAAELSLERFRLRGQRSRRHRDRLAGALRGARAVVRLRRATRRHQRLARGHGSAAGRPVPAGHAAQLRRGADRRAACATCSTGGGGSSPGASRISRRRCRAARRASTATRAGSAARTAPTSARSRRRCRRPWPRGGSR